MSIVLKLLIKKLIIHFVVELHIYSVFALETKFFETNNVLTDGGGRRPRLELFKSCTSLFDSLIVLAEVILTKVIVSLDAILNSKSVRMMADINVEGLVEEMKWSRK